MMLPIPTPEEVAAFAALCRERTGPTLTPEEAFDTCTRMVQLIYLTQIAPENMLVDASNDAVTLPERTPERPRRPHTPAHEDFLAWYDGLGADERRSAFGA